MPLIAQICMVVVTIALVGVAAMAIRLMFRTSALLESAHRSLVQLPALLEEARRMSARADELLHAFAQITRAAQAGVMRFEGLATRSGTIASSLLDEVERPISQAAAVIRGLRSGVHTLFQRWKSRAGDNNHIQRGDDDGAEQRWSDDGGAAAGSGGRGGRGAAVRTDGR